MTTERNREAPVPEEPHHRLVEATETRGAQPGAGSAAPRAPRTLAEELRTRGDEDLRTLLRHRPDLLTPVPNDLTQLATRAGTRASVARALERLDRFALQCAEALAVAPDPCSYDTLLSLLTGEEPDPSSGTGPDGGPDEENTWRTERETIRGALPRAAATLRARALLWGGDDRLRLVRTAREMLAPAAGGSPTGLGPTVAEATAGMSPGRLQEILAAVGLPATHDSVTATAALAELFGDRRKMADLLAQAPPEARALLDRLVWGPPYGAVSAEPAPPIRWLLARGLLLPAGPRNVVLPREAALRLRGGRAHRRPEPVPPAVAAAAEHRPATVDATAAGQAFTALATVEELIGTWEAGGPLVLRAGGVSVRDLKRTAAALDVSERIAAFWLELAYAAGLLASDGEADERYAATPAYDEWLELPAERRWAALVAPWLVSTRTSGLVGGQDAKGRTLAALGPELDRSAAPEVRRRTLELLAALPEGAAPDPAGVLARLRWEHGLPPLPGPDAKPEGRNGAKPAAPDTRSRIARWTLEEAELLGVTGRGALAAHGRALLGGPRPGRTGDAEAEAGTEAEDSSQTEAGAAGPAPGRVPHSAAEVTAAAAEAATVLAPQLPEPLDHVLLQADLTAVAPGPLRRPLALLLGVAADVESKGGATVYRFTPASVRRALDAGQTAAELHAFLAEHSRTPVPQPLSYLIDDVARRHGQLRVGAASSYLRCDDEALLSEILADRRSATLRPRRLAPTVLATQAAPDVLLARLREMGYAPAAESAAGDVVVTRADARRTPPRAAPVPVPEGPPVPDDTLLAAAVRAIRAGDLAATAIRRPVSGGAEAGDGGESGEGDGGDGPSAGGLPRTSSAETLATMQAAALTSSAVWIGYVNAEGAASQRVIAPVRVEGGFVTAYDHTADEVRTYALHRITGVAELADDAV
ncbi:helicase-associated domain-containing protein [Streptomyces sp. URMC 123]|uniref:helicase-associated domain-containing protein n=1 Tax=Streptomyces sp. URMC 123 TaxID=3423403 RepID=UPI003F19F8B5